MVVGSRLIANTYTLDFARISSKDMLNLQTTKDIGLNLNFVRDVTKRYSQMHCKYKYSHLS